MIFLTTMFSTGTEISLISSIVEEQLAHKKDEIHAYMSEME